MKFALACGFVLCCWGLAAHGADAPSGASPVGQRRPAFDLPDVHGKAVSMARWDGRVIVLNFWATWCTPCRKEIPLLNALQTRYMKRGVQIVGLAVDNTEAVTQFMRSVPIRYPVLIGDQAGIEIIEAYGDHAGALPYTVFINRAGIIASMASGALTEEFARSSIERLLATNN
ncbi:MAG: TlpA family protein disulfide reductase [Gammaproteobacteria bacterium]|nr:TlpA family protein disulfide reductase [Gammaproteobacteria bacterium]